MFSDSKNKLKELLKKQQKTARSDEDVRSIKDNEDKDEDASVGKENNEPEKEETEKKRSSKKKKKKEKENEERKNEDASNSLSSLFRQRTSVLDLIQTVKRRCSDHVFRKGFDWKSSEKDKKRSFLPSLKSSKPPKLSKSLTGESSTQRNDPQEDDGLVTDGSSLKLMTKSLTSTSSVKEDEDIKTPQTTKRLKTGNKKDAEKDGEEIDDESEVGSEVQDQQIVDEDCLKRTKKKRKKRKKTKKKLEIKEDKEEDVQQPPQEIREFDEDYFFAVVIHGSEHLSKDLKFLSHPLVRISIVDPSTGRYIRKSNSSSAASNEVDFVMPVLTQAFDFKKNNSLLPRWEETLIFNQPIKDLLTAGYTTQGQIWSPIVFFVIRDFKSMMKSKNDVTKIEDDRGWHNCAWAFLKLIGQNGDSNINKRCRLQLYKPPKKFQLLRSSHNEDEIDPVFHWWLSSRDPYNSTLFISIKPLKSKELKIESSSLQLEEDPLLRDPPHPSKALQQNRPLPTWSRLPNQDFKVPNTLMLRLWAGSQGAFTIKFSNKGYLLAAGCRHGETFPILIYNIPYGELIGELCGHQQLIYDIDWSLNDDLLLSASGDGTAQVWTMKNTEEPIYTLSHPAYVYTAKFHPVTQHVVVTAGFDKIIRFWSISSKKSELLLELEGHKTLINTLTFDKTGPNLHQFLHLVEISNVGSLFYSGDDDGVILCWNSSASDQTNWSLKKRLDDGKLKSFGVNRLEINPKNSNKLLVCCKNSDNKMFDVRIQSLQSYHGVPNKSQLIGATMTPCGSFIFAANADGSCYVWNTETGDHVAMYDQLGYQSYVRDVTYHPHDHFVAVCSFDSNSCILIYKYDIKVELKGVKLGNFVEEVNLDSNEAEDRNLSKLDLVKKQLDSYVLGSSATKPLLPASKLIRDERRSDLSTSFRSQKNNLVKSVTSSPHTSIKVNEDWKMTSSDEQKRDLMTSEICRTLKMSATQTTNQYVLVLRDYKSNRSDELTVYRDDVIKVIFKDGDKWWFGENSAGNQGYFPTSHVTTTDGKKGVDDSSLEEDLKIEDLKTPKKEEELFSSRGRRRANRIKNDSSFANPRPLPPLIKPKAQKRKSRSPNKDPKQDLPEVRQLSSSDEPRKKHKNLQQEVPQFGILKAIQQKLRESNQSSNHSDEKSRRSKRRHRRRDSNDVTFACDTGIQNEAFED